MSSFEQEVLFIEREMDKIERKIQKIENNDKEIQILINRENKNVRPKVC